MSKCQKPQTVYLNRKNGKYDFVYNKYSIPKPLFVDCKKCSSCQQKWINEIGLRTVHEMSNPEYKGKSAFVTLTVADEHLQEIFPNGSLTKRPYQLFIKKLRKHLKKELPEQKIRYAISGEYGELFKRPHYHLIIMGFEFPDKRYARKTNGNPEYVSSLLSRLWPYGKATIGTANIKTAKYLGKYVAKAKGKPIDHVDYLNHSTGELREKEFYITSKGFGKYWAIKSAKEICKRGYFVPKGKRGDEIHKEPIPRYYKDILKVEEPELYRELEKHQLKALRESQNKWKEENFVNKPDRKMINHYKKIYGYETDLEALDKISMDTKHLVKHLSEDEILQMRIAQGKIRDITIKSRQKLLG